MEKKNIVIATGNKGKLKELQQLLQDQPFFLISQTELSVSSVEETGLSFVENALIKARHAAKETGLPAIADDSGLAVDYLQGRPGIYSARFSSDASGKGATDEKNNQKLLEELTGVTDGGRGASFHCALVYVRSFDDPVPVICEGVWPGTILESPQGENGFGYDPLFWVAEQQCSSAQLDPTIKNKISHRGRAFAQLKKFFTDA